MIFWTVNCSKRLNARIYSQKDLDAENSSTQFEYLLFDQFSIDLDNEAVVLLIAISNRLKFHACPLRADRVSN